ncbi:MAG: hypothetical protein JXA73_16180 [Acidobacteria bacterium]|nr:hypothetical protein [Acidobacteriota bacterium]
MRQCKKCSAIVDPHLNFCQVCGAMLEEAAEESIRDEGSDKIDEKPEKASIPPIRKNKSSAARRPTHLIKELVAEVLDDLADRQRRIEDGDSQLTLLNLSRYATKPTRTRDQCPICGSTKTVPNVSVRCKSADGEGDVSIYLDAAPDSPIFIEHRPADLLADICSDCGHVALKVSLSKEQIERQIEFYKKRYGQ